MSWRYKSFAIFTLLVFSANAKAQYSLKYEMNDSLECFKSFYVNVYNDSTKEIEAQSQTSTNWWKFKLLVENGDYKPFGEIEIDHEKVYANNDAVVITLTNYLGDTLTIDSVKIPKLQVVRLNYLQEIPSVGERLLLDIGTLYSNGAAFKTLSETALNWNYFTITCRDDTFNPYYFFIPYYPDSPQYLPLIATYNNDTSIKHGFYLECKYADTLKFDFSGVDGAIGRKGKDGKLTSAFYKDGRWGMAGVDGGDAMNLNLAIIPLESEESTLLKVVFIGNDFNHYVFLNPEKGKVKIDLTGGNGGRGGNGGNGASGNINAKRNSEAQGGDGADGGNGGNGGNGGELRVVTNKAGQEYANLIVLNNDAGKGGLGGFGGIGGQTYVRENAGFFEKKLLGKNGLDGEIGNVGMQGYSGPGPVLWLVDDAELLKVLMETEIW